MTTRSHFNICVEQKLVFKEKYSCVMTIEIPRIPIADVVETGAQVAVVDADQTSERKSVSSVPRTSLLIIRTLKRFADSLPRGARFFLLA